jgi:hypothetical protein
MGKDFITRYNILLTKQKNLNLEGRYTKTALTHAQTNNGWGSLVLVVQMIGWRCAGLFVTTTKEETPAVLLCIVNSAIGFVMLFLLFLFVFVKFVSTV